MKLASLEDLYVAELKDLFSAEQQLLKALPKMAKAATAKELKQGFQHHLKQTRGQIQRLRKVFADLDAKPSGKRCVGMEGLIKEGEEMIKANAEPEARDAALIAAAQRVEHYEIAGYGCVRTYAKLLGLHDAADLLQETLDEEAETDEKLSELAEEINVEAEELAEHDGKSKVKPRRKKSRGKSMLEAIGL
jgi:ferritin-like metal-binding protein YciE